VSAGPHGDHRCPGGVLLDLCGSLNRYCGRPGGRTQQLLRGQATPRSGRPRRACDPWRPTSGGVVASSHRFDPCVRCFGSPGSASVPSSRTASSTSIGLAEPRPAGEHPALVGRPAGGWRLGGWHDRSGR
jgi:hypothetical protein